MGSQLEDLEVQVIDENGTVDNLMEGFPHSLTIDWNFEASLPLHHGACRLPAITLPAMPGTWHGRVAHAFHPELFFVIEVPRPKTIQLTYKSLSFNSMGIFINSSSPMAFHYLFCLQNQYFLSACGACLEVSV